MTARGRDRPLAVPLRLLGSGQLAWSASVAAGELAEADTGDAGDAGDSSVGEPATLRIGDVEVPPASRVETEVLLERIGGGVSVSGQVQAPWVGPCVRCTEPVEGMASAAVRETFTAHPREGEQYQLGTEVVDLAPMVREAVLLELPIHSVRCGEGRPCIEPEAEEMAEDEANRDSGDHDGDGPGDEAPAGDPRWAALDALRGQVRPED